VLLDGSFSSDPDSSPGTNDDIVRFQWFEDYGLPSQKAIGMGESLSAQLAVGSHRITLKVTDRAGLASTDDLAADVVDTAPPTISVVLSPHRLWPPDHHLVDIDAHVRVGDLCGKPARTLISIVSSEPDDAIGPEDGRTTGDIRGATFGSADFHFKLRAERDRRSSGRTYTVTYRATDSSGNAADASGTVVVRRARASSQP
jgi:hypothetical protein